MTDNSVQLTAAELKSKLNGETAKISWRELQLHFARGVVFCASPDSDLVELALQLSQDNKQLIQSYLDDGSIAKMNDQDAASYGDGDLFWAVVVAPWVLVQKVLG